MNNNKLKINNIFISIIVSVLGVIQFVKWFSFLNTNICNISILFIGMLSYLYIIYNRDNLKQNLIFLIFVGIYTVTGFISFLYNSNMDFIELLWPVGYMGLALLFINYSIPYKTIKWVYRIFIITFIIVIIFLGIDNIGKEYSHNVINVYTFLLFGLFVFSAFINKKNFYLFDILLFILLCFLTVGRSGIVTSIIALIFFMFFNYENGNNNIRSIKILLSFVVGIFILSFIVFLLKDSLFKNAFDYFKRMGLYSIRTTIWADYIKKVFESPMNFIFGAPINGTETLDLYSQNLHNSFLMLHAKYGLIMLILNIILMVGSVVKCIKSKNLYFLMIWAMLFFRMNFDYTNFNDCLDTLFVYLSFYFIFNKNNKLEKNEKL